MKLTKEWLEKEYSQNKRSFQDIADELKTYPNAVRRAAIKFGIEIRSKSEAQSEALKSERHKHPTKGQKRSTETKVAISEGVSKSWQNLPDSAYDNRVEKGRQQWEALPPEKKFEIQSKAIKAIRKTSTEGSKLEKFIRDYLKSRGFVIEFHKDNLLPNQKLEIDLFLPANNIAIEIDGPSHFSPIWGNEAMLKAQKADAEKNGLLLNYKINVIRVQQKRRNLSEKNLRDTAVAIEKQIILITHSLSTATVTNIEVN